MAWRINNPGLIKHHCRFAKKNGSIGAWGKFAIFSNPFQGHQALKEWLHSSTMLQSDLYAIGKHYQSSSPEQFAQNLALSSGIPLKTKLRELTQDEFETLLAAIEKLCGFLRIENEEFLLLPKIAARIECPGKENLYLVGKDLIFTFGGWSFIPPGVTHQESHNYASVGDLIPRIGSLNLQYLALRRYEGLKE